MYSKAALPSSWVSISMGSTAGAKRRRTGYGWITANQKSGSMSWIGFFAQMAIGEALAS
jgi:hypothetical protein